MNVKALVFILSLLPALSIAATDPLGLANGTDHLFVDNTNLAAAIPTPGLRP